MLTLRALSHVALAAAIRAEEAKLARPWLPEAQKAEARAVLADLKAERERRARRAR